MKFSHDDVKERSIEYPLNYNDEDITLKADVHLKNNKSSNDELEHGISAFYKSIRGINYSSTIKIRTYVAKGPHFEILERKHEVCNN